jgi:hypothetical protein
MEGLAMDRDFAGGQARGLAKLLQHAKGRGRKAQTGGGVRMPAGRPKVRRMTHEALHAALAGLVKA